METFSKAVEVSSHLQIVKVVLICKSIVSMRRESKNAIIKLKGNKQRSSCSSVTNELSLEVKIEQSFAMYFEMLFKQLLSVRRGEILKILKLKQFIVYCRKNQRLLQSLVNYSL